MSEKVSYMLVHEKCSKTFAPRQTCRLVADQANNKRFKYQDLLDGRCPVCHEDIMAWIGIDYLLEPVEYVAISHKKHRVWIDRFDTDLVRTHDPKAHHVVNGCAFDRNSGRWLYLTNIPVA